MGYFSNGSEGEYLDSQCGQCLHLYNDGACPVALVQHLYNYKQKKQLRKALNMLIDEHGDCHVKIAIDKYMSKTVGRICLNGVKHADDCHAVNDSQLTCTCGAIDYELLDEVEA